MTSEALDLADRLRAEAERLSESPEFARAPVMRRLLNFLVEETAAGRGDELKAYGVAVDGLGRPSDFDPQADSYPRVQVGRLRRMIEQYYQRSDRDPATASHGRLLLPSGGYRLHWQENGPAVSNPSHDKDDPEPAENRRGFFRPRYLLLVLALLVLIVAAFWFLRSTDGARVEQGAKEASPAIVPSPDMVIEPIRIAEGADPIFAQRINRILSDALPRSWMLTVRTPDQVSKQSGYRLSGTLVGSDRKLLYLALWDAARGEQIWSKRVEAGVPAPLLRKTLYPILASLMSPFGVIGAHERRALAGDDRPGFPCMMRYSGYYLGRKTTDAGPVARCLAETLRLDPGNGPATNAQVISLFRSGAGHPDHSAEIQQEALRIAQQAVDADAYSADAQSALGLASYASGQCAQGRASMLRALDINPYDAYTQGRAGLQMFQCGDADYAEHLDMAWQLDPALPAVMAMPVIMGMAEHGKGAEALHFAQHLTDGGGARRSGYALTMAVAYAGAKDLATARRYWLNAVAASGAKVDASPANVLQHILFTTGLMRRTENYLRARGLLR